MIAVVSAAIKACLINMNFIAMCPSDKRPRLYASGSAKQKEKKRRLDNVVADTSELQSFVVTTTAAAEPSPSGPVVQE